MKLYQVDSFTSEAFCGNPAAVCISDEPLSERLMQNIAAEMNLSETAFLAKADKLKRLRWFTPTTEVTLCGHATLAAAYILYTEGYLDNDDRHSFSSASGELIVSFKVGDKPQIEMDFPLISTQSKELPLWVGEHFENVLGFASTEKNDIVELENTEVVQGFRPDFAVISKHTRQGLIITAAGNGNTDFVSRYFVPNVGVPEDPVTGSAHCELAHYWQQRLEKNTFRAYQASARGGSVELEIQSDRVLLRGNAVVIFKTDLLV